MVQLSMERLVRDAFDRAADAKPQDRDAIVREACGGDEEAISRAAGLLRALDAAGSRFEHGPDLGSAGDSAGAGTALPSLVGETMGGCRLVGLLGAGGMGAVYLARQAHPARLVAVKTISPLVWSASAAERFDIESRLLARLRHPGIAQVYHAGVHVLEGPNGRPISVPYFAMEFVPDAAPLDAYCRERLSGIRPQLELFARVCDAAHHGHAAGVIHRDLKPSNILVDSGGQSKIIDFGIATTTDADLTLHTLTGQVIGTPAYMAPEQGGGGGDAIDARSDVYALGAVLYELLAGRLPHDVRRMTPAEALRSIREDSPPRLASLCRACRGDLGTIVHTALAKDPARRYQSAGDLAADLRRYLAGEPIAARPPSVLYRMRKFVGRNRTLVLATAAVIASLAVSLAWSLIVLDRERAARRETEQSFDFVAGILESGDPRTQGGATRTVAEAVREGAAALDGEPDMAPALKAAMHNLVGRLFIRFGENDAAERHLGQALALRERWLGRDHVDTLDTRKNLVSAAWHRGDLAESERLAGRLAIDAERSLGPLHVLTTEAQEQLANCLLNRGELDQSERLFRQLLAICDRTSDPRPGDRLTILCSLGHLYTTRGEPAKAGPILKAAMEDAAALGGPESDGALVTKAMYARTLAASGDAAQAEALQRQVVGTFERIYGFGHERTLTAANDLAATLSTLGRHAETIELDRRVLDGMRALETQNHRARLGIARTIAEAALRAGTPGVGLPDLVRELGEAEASATVADSSLADARLVLAECLAAQGLTDEARAQGELVISSRSSADEAGRRSAEAARALVARLER